MKKSVAFKWIKALRSGDYEQTKHQLVKVYEDGSEAFCCLGVLCNLATESGYGEWKGTVYIDEESNALSNMLPDGVMEWSGIRTAGGNLPGINGSLWALNDAGDLTLSEIANVIEKNWKEL